MTHGQGRSFEAAQQRSPIESLFTECRVDDAWVDQHLGRQAEAGTRRELDGGRVVVVGGVFEASVPLPACGGYHPWTLTERENMLVRRNDEARRRDAAAALQSLGSAQAVLDMARVDAIREIRQAMRTHEEAFGVVIKYGACSPDTFGLFAHNAAMHGWCKPGHPVPCVSGVGQMPDGTGMPIAIDASMSRGTLVLTQPDALYRCEGKKSAEVWRNDGRSELQTKDPYGFVGVRREVETGAQTSIRLDMFMPGQGQAPGPASHGSPPAEAPRARMAASRRFAGLPSRVSGWIARQSVAEIVDGVRAIQWLAEWAGGMAVTAASPGLSLRPRPRPSRSPLAPLCPMPAAQDPAGCPSREPPLSIWHARERGASQSAPWRRRRQAARRL